MSNNNSSPMHVTAALAMMHSFMGFGRFNLPDINDGGLKLPSHPGIRIERTHGGAPIYARDNSIFNTSKYQPHQGKKECARRVATKCGLWYMPTFKVMLAGVTA